jgi:hypothetical protein
MTIRPPVRVAAVLGIIVAAGLGLAFFMLGRSANTAGFEAPPAHVTKPTTSKPAARQPTKERAQPKRVRVQLPPSGFPNAVDRAFRTHRVVVLVVYMPGSGVDAVVRKEARAGALASGAGYVPVSALNNVRAGQVVAKTGVLPAPAVVIVRRPGVVVATLGVTDRETVVQAVAQGKK